MQTLDEGSLIYHKLSRDERYLIIGGNKGLVVFKYCNESVNSDKCAYCGVEGCVNCEDGICTSCNETNNEVVDEK